MAVSFISPHLPDAHMLKHRVRGKCTIIIKKTETSCFCLVISTTFEHVKPFFIIVSKYFVYKSGKHQVTIFTYLSVQSFTLETNAS